MPKVKVQKLKHKKIGKYVYRTCRKQFVGIAGKNNLITYSLRNALDLINENCAWFLNYYLMALYNPIPQQKEHLNVVNANVRYFQSKIKRKSSTSTNFSPSNWIAAALAVIHVESKGESSIPRNMALGHPQSFPGKQTNIQEDSQGRWMSGVFTEC